ncbi:MULTISPECIES: putative RNA uridine N3 methyltransferase [Metallosphaera]|uniref:Uncharacterized protein n=3 Tax=Metallosphaera TaxID=41980 RepID=A4YCW5_METS5|nr:MULTISPECIES: putative RNA uridine N3 methyltransferase [Metallosphaera]ABP94267.1 conserved hypothetical protein [Metallosphaera sedula DSM 5348]AIM26254.1 hypothetical protein HA72_0090 [Metallosphaera sedula]AKV73270.1 hypothetical protein MsedA_0095 [Metallosphaera sedula]AKV75514.1 hypothetical protein MsedB_0095 [Metallosphaera sedula]AKV77760.1 hypothetical protein MsedC_0094 [Metallosphaera sedula]
MFPFPRAHPLNVAIYPDMFTLKNNLTVFTLEVSDVIRALVEFRVTRLYLVDRGERSHLSRIRKLMTYAMTPPYLKRNIGIDPDLSKAGLLQPINTPYHAVSNVPVEGEIRLVQRGNSGLKGCEGKNGFMLVVNSEKCKALRYTSPFYEGPSIETISELDLGKINNVVIASRSGLDPLESIGTLRSMYQSHGITLLIGPPSGGIKSLFKAYPSFNFIRKQGVSDVRSKEALIASLTVLNFILM